MKSREAVSSCHLSVRRVIRQILSLVSTPSRRDRRKAKTITISSSPSTQSLFLKKARALSSKQRNAGISSKYKHFFQQKSDTGVELELLQYYAYICLDVFKEEKPRVGEKIDTWLEFLTIQDTDKMETFLKKNKSFQTVYERVILNIINNIVKRP